MNQICKFKEGRSVLATLRFDSNFDLLVSFVVEFCDLVHFVAISWASSLPSWMEIFVPQHLTRRVSPSKNKQTKTNLALPSSTHTSLCCFKNWLHFLFWCCFAHKCPLSWVLESYNFSNGKGSSKFTSSSITLIF